MTRSNPHLAEDDTAPTQCLPDAFPFSFKYGFFCTCLPLEEALTTVPPEPTSVTQQPPWYIRNLFGKRKTAAVDANIAPPITISSNRNSSTSLGGQESAFNSSAALVKPQNQELLPFDDWLIVFVLGGPGSGKGTQCAKLVDAYGLVHISTGDLLREEVALGSELGLEIRGAMEEGKMVSNDVIRKLLLKAMESAGRDAPGFLIDGFPRTMEQAIEFENNIGCCNFILYYECPTQVLIDRLVKRGETSGRVDDNLTSIEKRIHAFERTSLPVIEHYMADGRVQKVNGNASIEEVTEQTFEIFDWVFNDEQTN